MTTFWSVFSAVLLAEICKMIIDRYIRDHVKKAMDTADEHAKKVKEELIR